MSILWLHLNDEVLMVLLLLMPSLSSEINHGLNLLCVQGEEDITEPLLVDPVPVPLIRHVL